MGDELTRQWQSRSAAIASALQLYIDFADHTAKLSNEHQEYVVALAQSWVERLDGLRSLHSRFETRIPDDDQRRIAYLGEALTSISEDIDRSLVWIDAFPSAVAELLPPAASTFRVASTPSDEATGRGRLLPQAA